MKHVVTNHHLKMLHGALKLNKSQWERLNSEIEGTNGKHPADLEAQRTQTHVVIILLSCCFIEGLANYYISSKCAKEQFKLLERQSILDKWTIVPSLFVKDYELPKVENDDLKLLVGIRNRLTHSKPKVTINAQVVHGGYLALRLPLSPEKSLSLPVRLIKHLCLHDFAAGYDLCVVSGLDPKVCEVIVSEVRDNSRKKLTATKGNAS